VNAAGARPGAGIALILGAATCFALMDNLIRVTGALVPVLLILWARYAMQAAVMTVWLAVSPGERFRSAHPRFQALRGALLLATSAMSFFGVQYLPVAEFTAINMLTPVLVTLLAATWLKETVTPLRWALVAGAFAGALIVIRPGAGGLGWPVVFPLAGAVTYATFQVLTSRLSALESPFTTHFHTGLTGTVLLTPILGLATAAGALDPAAALAALGPGTAALLVAIGLLGTTGHLLLILSLGMAPTATLMPFVYLQIGIAALVGWWLTGHVPDGWAWVGMAVVAACGAASAWLNLRAAGPRAAPVAQDTVAD
jgi:drug/metabolite transporter (DMT)-like permease